MALYAFEIPAFVYIGLALIVAIPTILVVFSFDWMPRRRHHSDQRDTRRLTQATLDLKRILGDRDRLHAEYALSRQQFEAAIREARTAAASEVSALQEQLAKRDTMLEGLKARLKEKSTATAPAARRKAGSGRGSDKSQRARTKPASRVVTRTKTANREASLH